MKRGVLVLSLFLVSVLVISGCAQMSQEYRVDRLSVMESCILGMASSQVVCKDYDLTRDGLVDVFDILAFLKVNDHSIGRTDFFSSRAKITTRGDGELNLVWNTEPVCESVPVRNTITIDSAGGVRGMQWDVCVTDDDVTYDVTYNSFPANSPPASNLLDNGQLECWCEHGCIRYLWFSMTGVPLGGGEFYNLADFTINDPGFPESDTVSLLFSNIKIGDVDYNNLTGDYTLGQIIDEDVSGLVCYDPPYSELNYVYMCGDENTNWLNTNWCDNCCGDPTYPYDNCDGDGTCSGEIIFWTGNDACNSIGEECLGIEFQPWENCDTQSDNVCVAEWSCNYGYGCGPTGPCDFNVNNVLGLLWSSIRTVCTE